MPRLVPVLLLGLLGCSGSAEKKSNLDGALKKDPPAARRTKLVVGDPAPPLVVSRWLRGEPVTAFQPGRAYVLDFWATWCGPCIEAMPHLDRIAAEYKDRGLTVVAVTRKDQQGNTLDAVTRFVHGRGSRYGFPVAFCDTPTTWEAYMEAADQQGIPCSFVVDKAGKIAFIGHPEEIDDVLPKVVDGTWRGQADVDARAKASQALGEIMQTAGDDPAKALARLDEFAKQYPEKAATDGVRLQRVLWLLQAKRGDEAKAAADPLLKTFTEQKSSQKLGALRDIFTSRQHNPARAHVDFGLAAADAALAAAGDTDPVALYWTAEAYHEAGKTDRAAELGAKAVANAGNEKLKAEILKEVQKYKGKEK